jgi:ribonucleotide reductase alpha subunit
VWNGAQFSDVEVVKTGESRKLLKVMLDNGAQLDCTPWHRFYVQDTYRFSSIREVCAANLQPGDALIKFAFPVINDRDWPDFPYACTHGFFCGDGTYGKGRPRLALYHEKKPLAPFIEVTSGSGKGDATGRLNYSLPHDLPPKFNVPDRFSLESRLRWLEGLADADGTITNNKGCESLQIGSINFAFLMDVKNMLQTLGVDARVSFARGAVKNLLPDGNGGLKEYDCQPLYRLLVSHGGLQDLARLGFAPKRLKFDVEPRQRKSRQFARVVAVEDQGRIDDTYCFSEPRRHMGVFNGILTGQCTEITLNTSGEEIAVCNLGSVNLASHVVEGKLDMAKLQRTVSTAMRMLDNVIDMNFYSVDKAKVSNLRHRPVGLGVMGFQDCLHELRIPYASEGAVEFADRSMEAVCYYAYLASTELAEERRAYGSYHGSLWSKGVLPHETLDLLAEARGGHVVVDRSVTLDWGLLKKRIRTYGMRNSNCVAIAPTATIANIIGVSASIEPAYQNLFVKSNLSGEFTVVNEYLMKDLKRLGIWDAVMVADLKHFDGSVQAIDRVPDELKRLYATAFEIDATWLIEAAARRQKWIDQAQSLNLYFKGASGKALDEAYKLAWIRGLKTTYYLRALGATSAEKSTTRAGTLNAVSGEPVSPRACSLQDPGCESCQ